MVQLRIVDVCRSTDGPQDVYDVPTVEQRGTIVDRAKRIVMVFIIEDHIFYISLTLYKSFIKFFNLLQL